MLLLLLVLINQTIRFFLKNILVIYPHWHPANLAGVQRPRLIGNYLTMFGWQPIILTVKSEYFEEPPDRDFERIFSSDFVVHRVNAFKVTKPRVIGDIGLRAFFQLKKEALKIIEENQIKFVWIPIPSFYMALMGRILYEKSSTPYGIDYIDPWIRDLTNQQSIRGKISQWCARALEPIAVKKASLISGVSTPYYEAVLRRNFSIFFDDDKLQTDRQINHSTYRPITHVGMPYGFDPNDHKVKLQNLVLPWRDEEASKIWLYAGAFLPNSHKFMQCFFTAISQLRKENAWDESIRLYFLGTGQYQAKSIKTYAEEFRLSDIVTERRQRYPYIYILNCLSMADTAMVIGSTEKHYTASKTYQSILCKRPVWAVFHKESSAVKVLKECKASAYTVEYDDEMKIEELVKQIVISLQARMKGAEWQPNYSALDKYSAKESARKLVSAIESVI